MFRVLKKEININLFPLFSITCIINESSQMWKLHMCIPPHLLHRALLYGGMKESQPGTTQVELKDTSASAFGILLKYMYSGRLNLLEIKVRELICPEMNRLNLFGSKHTVWPRKAYSLSYIRVKVQRCKMNFIWDLANYVLLMGLIFIRKEIHVPVCENIWDVENNFKFQFILKSVFMKLNDNTLFTGWKSVGHIGNVSSLWFCGSWICYFWLFESDFEHFKCVFDLWHCKHVPSYIPVPSVQRIHRQKRPGDSSEWNILYLISGEFLLNIFHIWCFQPYFVHVRKISDRKKLKSTH